MRIQENIPLAPLTTLGVGGPARWFVDCEDEADVAGATNWAKERGTPLFVLGGGSNLLVADGGFNGLVMRISNKGIAKEPTSEDGGRIFQVAAGEDWDAFVQHTVNDNCAGLECLAGIPGTAGGTPVQNVGAYGQEVANTITAVRAFDRQQNTFISLTNAQCQFGYRRSRFNCAEKNRYIVTRIEFRLTFGGLPCFRYADLERVFAAGLQPSLRDVADAVRDIRRAKGMVIEEGDPDCRSAGSFFKNPVVTEEVWEHIARRSGTEPPSYPAGDDHPSCVKLSAAWLIQKAGFSKGFASGRAAISSKHTLALVNRGGASASEILALASQIRSSVSERFSIDLEMEPVMLGF